MQDRHRELWPKTVGAKKIAILVDPLDAVVVRVMPMRCL